MTLVIFGLSQAGLSAPAAHANTLEARNPKHSRLQRLALLRFSSRAAQAPAAAVMMSMSSSRKVCVCSRRQPVPKLFLVCGCDAPGAIANAASTCDCIAEGEGCTVVCNPGFQLDNSLLCQAGQYQGSATCTGAPSFVARLSHSHFNFHFHFSFYFDLHPLLICFHLPPPSLC